MARIIVRAELTPAAKDKVDSLCESKETTQIALMSRMVEWFAGEDRMTQSIVLGQYPVKDRREVGRLILKKLAETPS